MDEQHQCIDQEREEAVNPHHYLLSISSGDARYEKVKQFWQLVRSPMIMNAEARERL